MADNTQIASGSGDVIATDEVSTLNGNASSGVKVPRTKVGFGDDGDYRDASAAYPLPTTETEGTTPVTWGPITTANANLFSPVDTTGYETLVVQVNGRFSGGYEFEASLDGTTYYPCRASAYGADLPALDDTFSVPTIVTVPVNGRYIRVQTSPDFVGSISGSYHLRKSHHVAVAQQSQIVDLEPSLSFPAAGVDPDGYLRRIAVTKDGQFQLADKPAVQYFRLAPSTNFRGAFIDTRGYNSLSIRAFGTWSASVTVSTSPQAGSVGGGGTLFGWDASNLAAPITSITSNGIYIFPALTRWVRIALNSYTSGSIEVEVTLMNGTVPFTATNVTSLAGSAIVTAGLAGIQAIGGNIAVGAAPTANPVPLAWDGTNTRRILTDASSGGIVLGSSTVANGQTIGVIRQTSTTPGATNVKASPGRLTMLTIGQGSTVAGFLHLYNATATTLGTTSDVHVYPVPASVANYPITLPDGGMYFSTGIGMAFTAGSGATDNTVFGSSPSLIANYTFI